MGHIQVAEACMGAIPSQADNAGLAMAVLGYDTFRFVFIGLIFFTILRIVVGCAVQEQHHVGVLFDGAGVAQVGKLPLDFSAARDS